MRLSIRHRTVFSYAEPARSSFNEVRLTPRSDEHQNLLAFSLTVEPAARMTTYRDHFGTLVNAFNIPHPHRQLIVTGHSSVVTYPRPTPPPGSGDPAVLRDAEFADQQAEWLHPSPMARGGAHLDTFTDHVRGLLRAPCVLDLLTGVAAEVHRRFVYLPGASDVSSTVDDLLTRGSGVCQDFAHLTIATLRQLQVPSRYVSGYFHAGGDTSGAADGAELELESHAWVQALVPGLGWVDVDPTNDCLADERHVTVAVGRDYRDVPPVRGVLSGGGRTSLAVTVHMAPDTPPEPEEDPLLRERLRHQHAQQ